MIEKEVDKIRQELFKLKEVDYKGKYTEDLLKEYELYVKIMDETSSRRQNANSFFLGLNSLIITIMGIFLNRSEAPFFISLLWLITTSLFGLILCLRWRYIIQEYKNLNSGRFLVIHLLEERLPAKLFKAEWDYLTGDPDNQKYGKLSVAEMQVPNTFMILYMLLFLIGCVLIFKTPNVYFTMTEFFNSTISS